MLWIPVYMCIALHVYIGVFQMQIFYLFYIFPNTLKLKVECCCYLKRKKKCIFMFFDPSRNNLYLAHACVWCSWCCDVALSLLPSCVIYRNHYRLEPNKTKNKRYGNVSFGLEVFMIVKKPLGPHWDTFGSSISRTVKIMVGWWQSRTANKN